MGNRGLAEKCSHLTESGEMPLLDDTVLQFKGAYVDSGVLTTRGLNRHQNKHNLHIKSVDCLSHSNLPIHVSVTQFT